MKVYVYRIDNEHIAAKESELLKKVSLARREKVTKLKNPAVRAESLAAGLLLNYAISEEAGLGPEDYEIIEGRNGKPELQVSGGLQSADEERTGAGQSGAGRVYCNLSHSGGFVAAVVSDIPVGIDVETKGDKGFRVTRRMFAEPEKDRVERLLEISAEKKSAEAEAEKVFRDIWTEKEAYLKCTGEGITGALDVFYKDLETCEMKRTSAADKSKNESAGYHKFDSTGYYVRTVRLYDGACSLSVCMQRKNFVLDIVTVIDL